MSSKPGDNINHKLPSHWKWCLLDDLKSEEKRAIISGPFGSNISSKYFVDDGIPVIRGNNLSLSLERFVDDGYVFVSEEKANELNTWAEKDDILFTAAGTIGQVGILEENTKYRRYIISNKQIRVRLDKKKIRPLFAYYWLASPLMIEYIQQRNTGSTIPLINLSIVKSLPIPLPPLLEQDKIISLVASLDDKIKLNHETSITLESIAQTIFKRWFIEFNFPDPMGKLQNDMPAMPPQGWRNGKLGEIFDITMGQSPPGESYNEIGNGTPFFQGRADFNFRFPTQRVFTTEPKRYAKKFDTLVSVRAPVGDMNVATEDCCIGRGLASVIHKNGNPSFTYYFLKELTSKFKSYEDNGTVFGSINKSDFESMDCIIPDENIITAFEKICRPLDDVIYNNERESSTLASLRDILMPKLMSGEIKV